MSGFDPTWLALREPADHESRNADLQDRVAARFSKRRDLLVLDLGCGAGSNLRALAPHLPEHQFWRMVDHDPALLEAARERLQAWADEAEDAPSGELILTKGPRTIRVRLEQADLRPGVATLLNPAPGLVTASALFDLVSPDWMAGFARDVAASKAAFYTVLTYDGEAAWDDPPHPSDRAVLDAFHAHQRSDKGFGPAAGPEADTALRLAFDAVGYQCEEADSAWVLGPADNALIGQLVNGIADAAAEAGPISAGEAKAWAAARATSRRAVIGHKDLFAAPKRR